MELVSQIDLSKNQARHSPLRNQHTHLEHDLFLLLTKDLKKTTLDLLDHSQQDLQKRDSEEDHEVVQNLGFEPLQADLTVVFHLNGHSHLDHHLVVVVAFLVALEVVSVADLVVHEVDMPEVVHGEVQEVDEVKTSITQNLYTNLIKKLSKLMQKQKLLKCL